MKLNWLDFLNESSTWETKVQAEEFLSTTSGITIQLTPAEILSVGKLESYMREQLAAIHFKRKLDLDYINERLAKVKLQLKGKKNAKKHGKLPSLSPLSTAKNRPVPHILDTLLFQFAHFLGETLDGETPYTVARCEAVHKRGTVQDCKTFYKKFRSLENSWRKEVLADLPNVGEVERCADFFISVPGTKFCSDACRFSFFALRKQSEIPGYRAEKQRRYRERLKSE